jgi:nucleoside-diphosphate-sugar epimerase
MKNENELPVVVVIGANGFVGKKLVETLLELANVKLITLERNVRKKNFHSNKTVIQGDLTKLDTLQNLLVADCIVVNLAYDFNMPNEFNLLAARNLAEICRSAKIKRLIHCSTASVFGRNSESIINESSNCNPVTEYALTKLSIEKILHNASRDNFEFINLRPTSIFGPNGEALNKLIINLNDGYMILNYVKSCLFNKRKLNLVSVETVVSAIIFMMNNQLNVDGETFIVSEDYEDNNNFRDVESYLLSSLVNKDYLIRPFDIPLSLISFILRILRRDSYNPLSLYDPRKIMGLGFRAPRTLKQSLELFVEWQKTQAKVKNN